MTKLKDRVYSIEKEKHLAVIIWQILAMNLRPSDCMVIQIWSMAKNDQSHDRLYYSFSPSPTPILFLLHSQLLLHCHPRSEYLSTLAKTSSILLYTTWTLSTSQARTQLPSHPLYPTLHNLACHLDNHPRLTINITSSSMIVFSHSLHHHSRLLKTCFRQEKMV